MARDRKYEDAKLKVDTKRIGDKAKKALNDFASIDRQHRARVRNEGVDATPAFEKMKSGMTKKVLQPGDQGRHVLGARGR